MRWILTLAALLLAPAMAAAQDSRIAPAEDMSPRIVPTTGYTLALSWTPEYCHGARGAAAAECALPSARGFTLHGLWPDGADPKVWPQYCHAAAALTPAQVRAGSAATPSSRLLQHEWAKHGTCMSGDPASYFGEEQRVYRTIRFPDMATLSARRGLTVRQMQQAFAAANPGMTADMVRLNVNKRGWLSEVWLCLGLDKRLRTCPADAGAPQAGMPIRIQAPL